MLGAIMLHGAMRKWGGNPKPIITHLISLNYKIGLIVTSQLTKPCMGDSSCKANQSCP